MCSRFSRSSCFSGDRSLTGNEAYVRRSHDQDRDGKQNRHKRIGIARKIRSLMVSVLSILLDGTPAGESLPCHFSVEGSAVAR